MNSGYLAVVLAVVAGFFLLVAMALQICACVRTLRQARREKARLREIQEAAAESPPPYALVILDRNFPRPSHQECQCQVDGNGSGNRNICSIVGTSPSSTAGQNPNFQRTDEPPALNTTAEPLRLTGSNGTFCMLCFPHQRNGSYVNTTLCREMSSSDDADVISIPTAEKGNECKTVGNEVPPTYEEAIRYSISEEVS